MTRMNATLIRELRDGLCIEGQRCRVRDAASGCHCAQIADYIESLTRRAEQAEAERDETQARILEFVNATLAERESERANADAYCIKLRTERDHAQAALAAERAKVEKLMGTLLSIETHELRDWEDFEVVRDIAARARHAALSEAGARREMSSMEFPSREDIIERACLKAERMRMALEIIAGKRQGANNLMSNVDIALAGLSDGPGDDAPPAPEQNG